MRARGRGPPPLVDPARLPANCHHRCDHVRVSKDRGEESKARLMVAHALPGATVARHEARTAALALGMLADVQPAVMVCDVVMPDMDGYQLARQMKADEATAAVPVIFYTSTYPSLGARPTAEQLLLGRVVAKTGDVDALLDAVEDILNQVAEGSGLQPAPGRAMPA